MLRSLLFNTFLGVFFLDHSSVTIHQCGCVKVELLIMKGALESLIKIRFQSFKICSIKTDLFQCTLVIYKHLLHKCITCLKVLHRRYLQIFPAVILVANYDLRYQTEFSRPLAKLVFNQTATISYFDPRIWNLVPLGMKQKKSLTAF